MTGRTPFMARITSFARALARTRRGASSVEYGFILALIVLVLIVAFTQMADVTLGMWSDVSQRVIGASNIP